MGLIDLVFPKMCVACRREGQYICDGCRKKLVKPEQICPICCQPSLDGWAHVRCQKRGEMERLLVGLPYRGIVQECLKKVKYRSSWDVVDFLFSLCAFNLRDGFVVTAVPMFVQKERARGFNQANRVAKLLAKSSQAPLFELLERVRPTKPMYGLTKHERQENIAGVFRLKDHHINIPKRQKIILVDDVWTTGATMRECAGVLKKAGVGKVWGVVLAR